MPVADRQFLQRNWVSPVGIGSRKSQIVSSLDRCR